MAVSLAAEAEVAVDWLFNWLLMLSSSARCVLLMSRSEMQKHNHSFLHLHCSSFVHNLLPAGML